MARTRADQSGFTFFGVLFIVFLISLALSGAAMIWQVEQQREKESELLFIGQQYIDAIASYYHAAPGGNKKYPRSINDLLRDPRFLTVKRHLRKPWTDPLTHKKEWGLVYTKQGGIAGIYSPSQGTPLKQAGFGSLESLLAGKTSYHEWKFIYIAAADNTPKPAPDQQDADAETQSEEQPSEGTGENEEPQQDETGEELLLNQERIVQ